jgi:hypothetical protein
MIARMPPRKTNVNQLETEILKLCETGATLRQLSDTIVYDYSVIGKHARRLVAEGKLNKEGINNAIYTTIKRIDIRAHDPFGLIKSTGLRESRA